MSINIISIISTAQMLKTEAKSDRNLEKIILNWLTIKNQPASLSKLIMINISKRRRLI